jgi:hypothetical protein
MNLKLAAVGLSLVAIVAGCAVPTANEVSEDPESEAAGAAPAAEFRLVNVAPSDEPTELRPRMQGVPLVGETFRIGLELPPACLSTGSCQAFLSWELEAQSGRTRGKAPLRIVNRGGRREASGDLTPSAVGRLSVWIALEHRDGRTQAYSPAGYGWNAHRPRLFDIHRRTGKVFRILRGGTATEIVGGPIKAGDAITVEIADTRFRCAVQAHAYCTKREVPFQPDGYVLEHLRPDLYPEFQPNSARVNAPAGRRLVGIPAGAPYAMVAVMEENDWTKPEQPDCWQPFPANGNNRSQAKPHCIFGACPSSCPE